MPLNGTQLSRYKMFQKLRVCNSIVSLSHAKRYPEVILQRNPIDDSGIAVQAGSRCAVHEYISVEDCTGKKSYIKFYSDFPQHSTHDNDNDNGTADVWANTMPFMAASTRTAATNRRSRLNLFLWAQLRRWRMIVHDAQQWKYVHSLWRLNYRSKCATPL